MSRKLIEDYYREVDKIKQYSGSKKELSVRSEFAQLLNSYCRTKNLLLIQELDYTTKKGNTVTPDGTIKDALRLDLGYWESKDEYDDLDKEIQKKIEKGYPTTNILFEDTQTAVLIQQGQEVNRVQIHDSDKLDVLLQQFINYERTEIRDFHSAIEKFKEDLPVVLDALRELLENEGKNNQPFRKARDKLLTLCQEAINPKVTALDIREMLIQHILTEEIFITIFNESQFHRENTIAKELQKVADTFFFGKVKKDTLGLIDNYYLAIKAAASNIGDHHEKQKFLKVLYELFYRSYNPKAADRLGIFYTPNEIVQFMTKAADFLAYKHFEKLLSDHDVEILDPATGTGTFVTELIEQIPLSKLDYKYKKEIHCNEVAILPYYIANLNIEYTYKQKTGNYEPFENICFVDTLDNSGFNFKNKQATLYDIGDDNLERIKRQNRRKISIIIGNPPYNANQESENANNKNRKYPFIDKRIRETYVKASNAQKTKVYDMYARFYRWASDRLDKNGIIAFITNRSFIDGITYDGFRKEIQKEFNFAYIIDTKSDIRENPKLSGTVHNVFGIQTGIAVMFLVRNESINAPCLLQYFSLKDDDKKEDKLKWFATTKFEEVPFEHLKPDKKGNWTTTTDNDFESLLPLVSSKGNNKSIFGFYCIGVSTNRDEWVIDFDDTPLRKKIHYFIESYNAQLKDTKGINEANFWDKVRYDIKWSDSLKNKFLQKTALSFDESHLTNLNYRPFVSKRYYSDKNLSDRLTANHFKMFGKNFGRENKVICFSGVGSSTPFYTLASKIIMSKDFAENTQVVPLFVHNGKKWSKNITQWGIKSFREHYKDEQISSEAIFYYVYAVFHSKNYRKTYDQNLKRELPRIPLMKDFWKWAKSGEELMNIHLNFLTREPFVLKRIESPTKNDKQMRIRLEANKKLGKIKIDDKTVLTGIPKEAWEYRLRTRSAIEWILDQYKDKAPKDETIKKKFHQYDFEKYKEKVIDLIERVVSVSIETVRICEALEG